jgi:hypothetical protein
MISHPVIITFSSRIVGGRSGESMDMGRSKSATQVMEKASAAYNSL